MSAQISVPEIPPWVPPKPTKQDDIEWAPLNTLDLSKVTGEDFTEVPDDLVKTVGEAFRTSGFMYAENHGWTYDQVLRQFAVGQYAFDGVAPEDKDKYKADIIKSGSFVGYKAQGHWKLDGVQDRIEQLNFGSTSFSTFCLHLKSCLLKILYQKSHRGYLQSPQNKMISNGHH